MQPNREGLERMGQLKIMPVYRFPANLLGGFGEDAQESCPSVGSNTVGFGNPTYLLQIVWFGYGD
jgi:hypothetical protein